MLGFLLKYSETGILFDFLIILFYNRYIIVFCEEDILWSSAKNTLIL